MDNNRNFIIKLKDDSSLVVLPSGDLRIEFTTEELNSIKEGNVLQVVARKLKTDEKDPHATGLSAAISNAFDEYNSWARNDIRRSSLSANFSVNWLVETYANGESRVVSREDARGDGDDVTVFENLIEQDPATAKWLDEGIDSNIDQPVSFAMDHSVQAIHINDAVAFGDDLEYSGEIVLEGSDLGDHSATARRVPAKKVITLGHSYLIRGLAPLAVGHTTYEEAVMINSKRSDFGDRVEIDRVQRNVNTFFDVVDVTPVVGQLASATAEAERILTGLQSHVAGHNQVGMCVKALAAKVNELEQSLSDNKSALEVLKGNHLLKSDNIIYNGLYTDGLNSIRDVVEFTRGMQSLETFFMTLPLSNAFAHQTAIAEYIMQGYEGGNAHTFVNATHGVAPTSVGDHSMAYAARSAERISPNQINTLEKVLTSSVAVRDMLSQCSDIVLNDKILSRYAKDIRIAKVAYDDAILALKSSAVRDTSSVANNVDVILPSEIQFIVGINPNELIDVNITRDSGGCYHFDFDNNLHYVTYEAIDANNRQQQFKTTEHGVLTPCLLALTRFLSNDTFVNRFLNGNNIHFNGMNVTQAIDHWVTNGIKFEFNPNVFSFGAFLLGAAYVEKFDDVIRDQRACEGYLKLLAALRDTEGDISSVDAATWLANIKETIGKNVISPSHAYPPQFEYDTRVVNEFRYQKYPIANFYHPNLACYGKLGGKTMTDDGHMVVFDPNPGDEHLTNFDRFEPIPVTGLKTSKLTNLASLESFIAESVAYDASDHYQAGAVYFGPGVNYDDIFANGSDSVRTHHRSILMWGRKNTPVLFRKRVSREKGFQLAYGYRENAVADVDDIKPDNFEKALWSGDNFNFTPLEDAYVLVQTKPRDLTTTSKTFGRSHTTLVNNSYSMCPVLIFLKNGDMSNGSNSNRIYSESKKHYANADNTRCIMQFDQISRAADAEPTAIKWSNAGKFVIRTDVSDITIGNDSIVFTDTDDGVWTLNSSKGLSGADNIVFSSVVTYDARNAHTGGRSLQGYRRPAFAPHVFVQNDSGAIAYGSFTTSRPSGSWRVSDNWQRMIHETWVLRPYSYTIAELREVYNPGDRSSYYDGTDLRPYFNDEIKSEQYLYKHALAFYARHSHCSTSTAGVNTPIDDMATLLNVPLTLRHVGCVGENLTDLTCQSMVYTDYHRDGNNGSVAVRVNGGLTTSADDRYADHIAARYRRGSRYMYPHPEILQQTESAYVASIMWIGDDDYHLNRRITERNNYGRAFTYAYPHLLQPLYRSRDSRTSMKNVILERFYEGYKAADEDEAEITE